MEHVSGGNLWAEISQSLLRADTVEDYLGAAVEHAPELVEIDSSVSLSTVVHGNLLTVVSSDRDAWNADQVEFDTESGACVDALRHGRRSVSPDLTTEFRWPAWTAVALMLGFRSAAAVPALVGPADQRIALNMYSRTPHAFTPEVLQRATAFAQHLAQTLPWVLRVVDKTTTISHLEAALTNRSTIDQALGVLMTQNRCSRDEAFAILRRSSQNSNVKLRDLAAVIIERQTGHPAAPAVVFHRP